jgi:putative redox protein
MRHEIHIGRNSFATDLSVEEGGDGSGPSPHDLYDAALGACTALTVLWYAKRRSIPVEGIEVSVERDASQERAGIYRLSAALTLTGDLSAAQREELLHAAQKCPVHKLMTEVTTEISTALSD